MHPCVEKHAGSMLSLIHIYHVLGNIELLGIGLKAGIPIQICDAHNRICMIAVSYTHLLIYSTCTIHAAENEENARWFEQTHPEFTLDVMRQMFPEEQLGDGFFIAKFKRKQDNG